MAQDANGTPTSPDSIATILPSDLPAVSSLTSGVNAIAATTQTALTTSYPRIVGAKSTSNILSYNGASWTPQFVLNANVDPTAAIAYSKLNLTGAILNADLAGSIAYSKLNLTGAILNADLAGSIAYSKLSLSGSIIGSDISAGANISPQRIASTVTVVYRSTSQNFAAADGTVSFDTTLVNSGPTPMWSAGSPTRVTATFAGVYRVGVMASMGGTTGGSFSWAVRKNGTTVVMQNNPTLLTVGAANTTFGSYVTLASSDYLEIFWAHGTSTAATTSAQAYMGATSLSVNGLLEVEYIGT